MRRDTSNPDSVLVHQELADRQVERCHYSRRSVM